jgi:capsular polysaccharide biosynthesis protein
MRERPLDSRRSLKIVRRYLTAVGIATALGLVAGAMYTVFDLPMHASTALVALPGTTDDTATQILIADSRPVLSHALRDARPAVSLQTMRSRVHVTSLIPTVLSITAQAATVSQAESMANAVADSYVAYVGASNGPVTQVPAQVLAAARSATATRLPVRMLATTVLGGLLGALGAAIGVLAIGRGDRRLRERDEIADAIGVPVLASVPVRHPADAASWATLLEDYAPSTTDAWRLRNALRDLRLAGITSAAGSSLTILSLSSDQRALALGPQLAAFVASCGVPAALVIAAQRESAAAVALRAAATPPSLRRSGQLLVTADDHGDLSQQSDAALSIVVTVADGRPPLTASPARTRATVLAVSAGAATAEQLTRVVAGEAAKGRLITGILVANPDPADPTTGRLPQLTRPPQRMPTHLTGTLGNHMNDRSRR